MKNESTKQWTSEFPNSIMLVEDATDRSCVMDGKNQHGVPWRQRHKSGSLAGTLNRMSELRASSEKFGAHAAAECAALFLFHGDERVELTFFGEKRKKSVSFMW